MARSFIERSKIFLLLPSH